MISSALPSCLTSTSSFFTPGTCIVSTISSRRSIFPQFVSSMRVTGLISFRSTFGGFGRSTGTSAGALSGAILIGRLPIGVTLTSGLPLPKSLISTLKPVTPGLRSNSRKSILNSFSILLNSRSKSRIMRHIRLKNSSSNGLYMCSIVRCFD